VTPGFPAYVTSGANSRDLSALASLSRMSSDVSDEALLRRFASLETELQRLRSFFGQNADGMWCFELEPPVPLALERDQALELCVARGQLVECNDALARMYGYVHAHELIGTPLGVFLDLSREDNFDYLRRFWDSGLHLRDGESHERDREGNDKVFLNTLIGVTAGEHLVRVWGTQRDITPQRMIEARRMQLQRLHAVEELAAGIAHHFNNMLTVISGNLSLILENAVLASEDQEALQSASRAAEHAAGLTRQLLHFSQRHQPNFEPIDWREGVQAACQLLQPIIGDRVRIELDLGETPRVLGDAALVQQIVVHLVQHARQTLLGRGTIQIRLRSESIAPTQERVTLELRHPGHRSSRSRPHASSVDLFFSGVTHEQDPVTQLAQVYGIVRNLAGTLSAHREGVHTLIQVEIPAEREAPSIVAPLGRRSAVPELETVLVVEDDPHVLATVRRFLMTSGHRVLSARSVSEAIAIADRSQERIDLAIIDVVMPDKSGLICARELAARRPTLQLLLMSGRGKPPDLEPDLGHIVVMQKPFSREELDAALRKLLDRTG